ncbi:MAG: S4 domain-containing protein [Chromatiales bacterium]|nr:S4 domain-containing protein [Chromatiales bacterium]
MQLQPCDKVRLDKWLWAARFFKTRALATEAINGGHVHLNGSRPRPSRTLAIGDELTIRKGQESFAITVLLLSDKRGPAAIAQQLYTEDEESRLKREQIVEQRRLEAAAQPRQQRRPDKKGRRQIIRFINKNG